MKRKTFKKILFLVALLIVGTGAYADNSEYCKMVISNDNGSENTKAYLTWVTNSTGEIVITLSEYGENGSTAFRADGMKPLTGFKLNEAPLTDYFTQTYAGAGSNTMTFTPKNGVDIPADAIISFGGSNCFIEWKTDKEGNCYREFKDANILRYTYGTSCPQLATPTIINITEDGIITFNPVNDATKYIVYLFGEDGEKAYSQVVESGNKIAFVTYGEESATYAVKLQASTSGTELDSELSEAKNWTPNLVPLTASDICGEKLGGFPAYLSWITNSFGQVEITISGDIGSIVTFRGTEGMNINGFKYKVGDEFKPIKDYFTKTHVEKSNIITLTPKAGAGVVPGGIITFNKNAENQQIEWVENGSNKNDNKFSFEYTYATTCPVLATPAITSVDTDGAITFGAVDNAAAYKVYVYRDGIEVYTQIIAVGEKIAYVSYTDNAYLVKLQALANPNAIYMDSELSEAESWEPIQSPLGSSEYCNSEIKSGDHKAYLTWMTESDGRIVITISGTGEQEVSFRGNAMNDAGFKIYGEPLNKYFNRVFGGNKSTTLTYTPKEGVVIEKGDKITFNKLGEGAQIEWNSGTNGPNSNAFSFEYTYGTRCGELSVPVISSITADGAIIFAPVEHADNYKVYVYKGDVEVYSQSIKSGEKINFISYIEYTYSVKLQAFPAAGSDYADSELSEPKDWTLTATPLGGSEYCDFRIGTAEDQYAYISFRTNAEGAIIISLAGDESTAFRGNNGINANGFTIYGKSLSDYFDRSYEVGSAKVIYTPKADSGVSMGDKIKFNGLIEWKTASKEPAGTYIFEYTYGTTCPQLDTPEITNITADGTMTFDAIENAGAYMVYVYRDAFLVHTQNISYGDKIDFTPNLSYIYGVAVKAISTDGLNLDSELSDSYPWSLTADPIVLGKSEYCDFQIGDDETQYAYISFITNENGAIVITISGDGEEDDTEIDFRGNGINLDFLTMYGQSLKTYFTKTTESKKITLTPKDDNSILLGDVITYKGNIEWKKGTANPAKVYTLLYTYGTVCEDAPIKVPLTTPVISAIAKDGTVTFDAVDNADSYMVYVYDEDEDEIHSQVITPGGKITSPSIANYVYTVKLQALPAEDDINYLASALSAVYEWDRTEDPQPEKLATPVISAISNDSVLTFNAIAHADSYVVYVYKDGAEVYQQTIASGEKINFTSDIEYTYTVKLKAVPATGSTAYLESDLSAEYEWILKGTGTGIYDLEAETISFYPNPVTDVLYFTTEVSQASLYTLQGQLISNYKNVESIDVVNYPKGMYILQITDSFGNKFTHKVEIR